jgi:hypothetical protein
MQVDPPGNGESKSGATEEQDYGMPYPLVRFASGQTMLLPPTEFSVLNGGYLHMLHQVVSRSDRLCRLG